MSQTASGKSYVLAWVALVLLTALSFGASWLSLGRFNMVVALGIAALKTSIVLVAFMHLLKEPFPVRFVAALNLTWIAMLCAGIAADVAMR